MKKVIHLLYILDKDDKTLLLCVHANQSFVPEFHRRRATAELAIVTWEILNICGTATALHLRLFKVNFGHWARSQVEEHSLTAMPAVHVWILALKLKHVKISVKIPPPCLESPSSFRPPPIVLRSKGRSHSFNRYSISRHSWHSFFHVSSKKKHKE